MLPLKPIGKPVSEDQRSRSWKSKAQTCAHTEESEMRPAFARLNPERLTTVHAYFFSPSFPLYVSFAEPGCNSVSSAVTASCQRAGEGSGSQLGSRGQSEHPHPRAPRVPQAEPCSDPRSPASRGREPAGGMIISSLLPRLSPFYHHMDDTCSLLRHPRVSGPALPRLARASGRGGSPVRRDYTGGARGYGMSHRAAAAPSPAPRRCSACGRGSASPSPETREMGKRAEE